MKFTSAILVAAAGLASAQPAKRNTFNNGDVIRGVNLGGLFVLEPYITPSLFKQWENVTDSPVIDEWSFCATLGKDECSRRLEQHWQSWVTETDINDIARMGINYVRIPIGYWALSPTYSDPYVQGQIPHLKRILGWIGQRGLAAQLDLHGVPGSQNGFDNSGRRGDVRWAQTANGTQQAIDSLASLAGISNEFSCVKAIHAINEPGNWGINRDGLTGYYSRAYNTIRSINPNVSVVFHDAFLGQDQWANLIPEEWTNVYLDTHIYHVFDVGLLKLSHEDHIRKACGDGASIKQFNSRTPTIVGEFSLASTDCARWLNGFQRGARWDGTYITNAPVFNGATCAGQEDISTWSEDTRQFYRKFALAQFQAYEMASGWVFWNFKTEDADTWNYIKLWKHGIIPIQPDGRSYSVCQ